MQDTAIRQFADALPVRSGSTPPPHARSTVQAASSSSVEIIGTSGTGNTPRVEQATGLPGSHCSNATDESELSRIQRTHSTSSHNTTHGDLPNSTPTAQPLGGADLWTDDNLLSFWIIKALRKKGYQPIIEKFPGQTVESLREAWDTHKQRCNELGARWKAAGRPDGPVSEWLGEW